MEAQDHFPSSLFHIGPVIPYAKIVKLVIPIQASNYKLKKKVNNMQYLNLFHRIKLKMFSLSLCLICHILIKQYQQLKYRQLVLAACLNTLKNWHSLEDTRKDARLFMMCTIANENAATSKQDRFKPPLIQLRNMHSSSCIIFPCKT